MKKFYLTISFLYSSSLMIFTYIRVNDYSGFTLMLFLVPTILIVFYSILFDSKIMKYSKFYYTLGLFLFKLVLYFSVLYVSKDVSIIYITYIGGLFLLDVLFGYLYVYNLYKNLGNNEDPLSYNNLQKIYDDSKKRKIKHFKLISYKMLPLLISYIYFTHIIEYNNYFLFMIYVIFLIVSLYVSFHFSKIILMSLLKSNQIKSSKVVIILLFEILVIILVCVFSYYDIFYALLISVVLCYIPFSKAMKMFDEAGE